MKNIIFALIITTVMLSLPKLIEAQSSKKPVVLDSDEWTLTLSDAEIEDENMSKSNEKADVYSLKIANKDGNKYNVTLHSFRKEKDKSYDYGLSLNDTKGKNIEVENEEVINFKNFPIAKGSEEIEVFIMWQDEPSGRFYKQDFIVPVK